MLINSSNIKVSICCQVYNHEKYLDLCLKGFVNQKTNFKYEILVHEDASTDRTAEILKEYEERYPLLFRCVYQDENKYYKQNTLTNILFKMAKGKYLAVCEGDDYWTDPYKLQKQVNFLEANPDYVLTFHKIAILNKDNKIVHDFITKVPDKYETIETLATLGNYIHTPSIVFRNVIDEFPSEFMASPIGDYFIYMLLAKHGKLKYFDETMAVYRYGAGVHSKLTDFNKNWNTAITFSLLISYFTREKEHHLAKIFLQRLSFVIDEYHSILTKEDLLKLDNNEQVNDLIFDAFTSKINQLLKNSYHSKTTNQLLKIILLRVKKRIKNLF